MIFLRTCFFPMVPFPDKKEMRQLHTNQKLLLCPLCKTSSSCANWLRRNRLLSSLTLECTWPISHSLRFGFIHVFLYFSCLLSPVPHFHKEAMPNKFSGSVINFAKQRQVANVISSIRLCQIASFDFVPYPRLQVSHFLAWNILWTHLISGTPPKRPIARWWRLLQAFSVFMSQRWNNNRPKRETTKTCKVSRNGLLFHCSPYLSRLIFLVQTPEWKAKFGRKKPTAAMRASQLIRRLSQREVGRNSISEHKWNIYTYMTQPLHKEWTT